MNATDHDFFRTLIEDRRQSFAEWLSAASKETRGSLPSLQDLEEALERIRTDGFGVCTACDGAVEQELLAAMPAARLCLDCMAEGERRRLEEDLEMVQEVNRWLLPRKTRDTQRWDLGIAYQPSRILSGDFYDLVPQPGSRAIGLAVGDVAGNGMPAGLLRTSLQATVRALGRQGLSPDILLKEANRHFLEFSHSGRFASAFYGILESDRGTMTYANSGHPPPLLRRSIGTWEALPNTGVVLGVSEGLGADSSFCAIEAGDLLLLYTDGITETRNAAGRFFDSRKLMDAVDRHSARPAQEIVDRVIEALDRFSGMAPADDRTLIIYRQGNAGRGDESEAPRAFARGIPARAGTGEGARFPGWPTVQPPRKERV